jgi:hypothetical protein
MLLNYFDGFEFVWRIGCGYDYSDINWFGNGFGNGSGYGFPFNSGDGFGNGDYGDGIGYDCDDIVCEMAI